MKRVLILGPLLLALGACDSEPADDPTVITTDQTTTSQVAAPPPAPQPAADGPCPYLEQSFVEETNGQRVSKTATSADNPPACFFYRPDGSVQLTVQIYTGDPGAAKALVDHAAPVDTANPAELPGGWAGGAQPTGEEGAVYAVAKDKSAVVVTTNQGQTIKAKQIAQQAITTLGL